MQQPEEGRGAIGFLTTVASASHGVFGGYLLVDEVGRPLEFHCTAPVRVSRAQEILYGPYLNPMGADRYFQSFPAGGIIQRTLRVDRSAYARS